MKKTFIKVLSDERGVSGIEYGFFLAGISVALVASVFVLGEGIQNTLEVANAYMADRLGS